MLGSTRESSIQYGDLEGVFQEMHAEDSGLTGEQRMLIMRYLMRGGFRGLNELHKKGWSTPTSSTRTSCSAATSRPS